MPSSHTNMILFFGNIEDRVYAVQVTEIPSDHAIEKLEWLFANRKRIPLDELAGKFIGPRVTMVTPWSTNAVEITQNMGVSGIKRIEQFIPDIEGCEFDPMISQKFEKLGQALFDINTVPHPILDIEDIAAYNTEEGLSLSSDEVIYLENLSKKLGRALTDSEVFGFSQVNSEHCRHKIFNGTFIIDGEEKQDSLFQLIKKTSKAHPNSIVSAYKDNVAFIKGPKVVQFAPERAEVPSNYKKSKFESVISLKAETHNFPTTVEPFNGAATGSGGEIRDRLAGGQGSIPLAGTAVYMTSYPRLSKNKKWESKVEERQWLYQTPMDILIKASNGASDFGNKFGQPLITGSILTFENEENGTITAYDKVIMQAGGIGYGKLSQAQKHTPDKGDQIVILGGDNYRIGMGGAAVSSADTGDMSSSIELNAVQRSNPEMQKRVANAIRGLVENEDNPIVSIHDHGAGGHLNCLSELVEEVGGHIGLNKLPLGDPTLSAKEIIGNESQERMGLIISDSNIEQLRLISERERAPFYKVGEVSGDNRFLIESDQGDQPMNLELSDMFGSSPKTIMNDESRTSNFQKLEYDPSLFETYLADVLRLESVACKDWLTNKVDRCVGGRVAKQQCVGPLQLPLNNLGVMALDYDSTDGIATSIGHASIAGLIDAAAGARQSVLEALTNIVWAPLNDGLQSVSLSANWMWPCRNPGEDARLYSAVEAISQFCIDLGINVPTGKDSLSMKQKYNDKEVISPGTVVISAAGHCSNINNVIEPLLQKDGGEIYYISFTNEALDIGGSAFAQTLGRVGDRVGHSNNASYSKDVFQAIQKAINGRMIQAGHDISSGGLITTLLELCFADVDLGAEIDLSALGEVDTIKVAFAENPGVVIQANSEFEDLLTETNIVFHKIGKVIKEPVLNLKNGDEDYHLDIVKLRDLWYEPSYLFDRHQTAGDLPKARYQNYKNQPLLYQFPAAFTGKLSDRNSIVGRPQAAIIREKGSNSEREMAHALYLAGFDVRDVHMTDLISGRETLEDVRFLGAVGGFSNSDVLGSAKGWAGAFKYNEKARVALERFFAREDVLSVGICNGCQLFLELDLICPDHETRPYMDYNDSKKHESAFTSVKIGKNNSVMLTNLEDTKLGVWISHGEGKFVLPEEESHYNIVAKYAYEGYPSNPNGSNYNAAMLSSADGRHLATMPHIERSIFQWNWAHYEPYRDDEVSPWLQAFVNAREWILQHS